MLLIKLMETGLIHAVKEPSYMNICKPLKRQEKKDLKMSSAEVVCCKQLPSITDELSIEANSVGVEQIAPKGAV